jgi:hypothetical protein
VRPSCPERLCIVIGLGDLWKQESGAAATTHCRGYQQGRRCSAMTRHTLIVEGPAGSVTTLELFVDDPAEVWRIGHELFPGSRLAAVNHEDEEG